MATQHAKAVRRGLALEKLALLQLQVSGVLGIDFQPAPIQSRDPEMSQILVVENQVGLLQAILTALGVSAEAPGAEPEATAAPAEDVVSASEPDTVPTQAEPSELEAQEPVMVFDETAPEPEATAAADLPKPYRGPGRPRKSA